MTPCANYEEFVKTEIRLCLTTSLLRPTLRLALHWQSAMAHVLCTGVDEVLVKTRRLILEAAGHIVTTALNPPELDSALQTGKYDIAVIGQAMFPDEKQRIFAAIRQRCPSAKVLELYPEHRGKTLPDADDWLQVPVDVPPQLAERVTALASRKQ
jgi:CheY-like chemotaxis protein